MNIALIFKKIYLYYIGGPKRFGAVNKWPHSSAGLPTPALVSKLYKMTKEPIFFKINENA